MATEPRSPFSWSPEEIGQAAERASESTARHARQFAEQSRPFWKVAIAFFQQLYRAFCDLFAVSHNGPASRSEQSTVEPARQAFVTPPPVAPSPSSIEQRLASIERGIEALHRKTWPHPARGVAGAFLLLLSIVSALMAFGASDTYRDTIGNAVADSRMLSQMAVILLAALTFCKACQWLAPSR